METELKDLVGKKIDKLFLNTGYLNAVYGYSITLEPKENDYYGERTAVFSFRNESNGYYGGWIEKTEDREVLPEITEDVLEVKEPRS
jgi:hypothetical protein